MIDVRDLRIGNCFYVDELEKHLVVSEIDCCSAAAFVNGEMITFNNVNLTPIPITPEWLKDFGFTRHGVDQWKHQDFPFIVEDDVVFYSLIICDSENESGFAWLVKFDYVHELQNLIYSLTKQKLTIGGGE